MSLRSAINSYKDLIVWQKARQLVKRAYVMTGLFPKNELYGLTQQIRRAAVSVASNIAEGYGRGTRKEYIHFLYVARGSLYELETQLLLAQDLNLTTSEQDVPVSTLAGECSRLLHGLLKSLTKERENAQMPTVTRKSPFPGSCSLAPSPWSLFPSSYSLVPSPWSLVQT